MRRRLASWLEGQVASELGPLLLLRERAPAGAARGLAFALVESLGSVSRRAVASQLKALHPEERRTLARLGVVLGRTAAYLPALLAPATLRLRRLLWQARQGGAAAAVERERGSAAAEAAASNGHALASLDGRPSVPLDRALPESGYWAGGYAPARARAVRVDRLEHLAAVAHRLAREGPFAANDRLAALVGCPVGELAGILGSLGFTLEGGLYRHAGAQRKPARRS